MIVSDGGIRSSGMALRFSISDGYSGWKERTVITENAKIHTLDFTEKRNTDSGIWRLAQWRPQWDVTWCCKFYRI
jgi:hypothetical protein